MEGRRYKAAVAETEKSLCFASLVAITSGKSPKILDWPVVLYATRGQPAMLYGRNPFVLISHVFLSVF